MLYFMVLLVLYKTTYAVNKNVGSALFSSAHINSNCWTADDIAKLQARKLFECLIPPSYNPEKVNNKYIQNSLRYFRSALISVQKDVDQHTAEILKEALADTLGAHLKYEILPPIRFAYYAGYIPFRSARKLHDFYEQVKLMLNTQGVGWKQPERIPKWSNLTVAKIFIGSGKLLDPCASLVIKRDANSCIHLPPPRLDDNSDPSAIALPFKSEALVNLKSSNAENIVLKYYTTALRCLLNSSPAKCRHEDVVNFNNELWNWMKRNVAPHLVDENLYAAYGGILRIAAAVQNYGKGLSRRNLFDYQEACLTKWNPWKALTESYNHVNTNWTPAMYIGVVILIALTMYFMQSCYYCTFGKTSPGLFRKNTRSSASTKIVCAKVERGDNSFEAIQPQQNEMFSNNQEQSKHLDKSKSPSIKNQTVYDLNENIERVMPVLFSNNENSDVTSTSSKSDSEDECTRRPSNITEGRPKSPPKLDTPIAQLTIEKQRIQNPVSGKKITPMYSTSTLTHSGGTFCKAPQHSGSAWSVSSTSMSGKSVSTTSSKSRSQKSRSSRDLAWARMVIARNSRKGLQSSGPDFDVHSFTTSQSRR